MPKVAATLDAVNAALNALRQAPASPDARAAGEQASAVLAEFADVASGRAITFAPARR